MPDLRRRFISRFRRAPIHDDARAFPCKRPPDGKADAIGGSGDERSLAFELEIHGAAALASRAPAVYLTALRARAAGEDDRSFRYHSLSDARDHIAPHEARHSSCTRRAQRNELTRETRLGEFHRFDRSKVKQISGSRHCKARGLRESLEEDNPRYDGILRKVTQKHRVSRSKSLLTDCAFSGHALDDRIDE